MLDKIIGIKICRTLSGTRWQARAAELKKGSVREGEVTFVPIGFGDTPKEALKDFLRDLHRAEKKKEPGDIAYFPSYESFKKWNEDDIERQCRKEMEPVKPKQPRGSYVSRVFRIKKPEWIEIDVPILEVSRNSGDGFDILVADEKPSDAGKTRFVNKLWFEDIVTIARESVRVSVVKGKCTLEADTFRDLFREKLKEINVEVKEE